MNSYVLIKTFDNKQLSITVCESITSYNYQYKNILLFWYNNDYISNKQKANSFIILKTSLIL